MPEDAQSAPEEMDDASQARHARWVAAAADLVAVMDGLARVRVNRRRRQHHSLLHGIAFYTRDVTRAALHLIEGDMGGGAAALSRVVLEHGVMAQWLALDPDHADRYLTQQQFDSIKFKDVVTRAGMTLPHDIERAYQQLTVTKADQDVRETRRVFEKVDPSSALYLQYRFLSGFVHPGFATMTRYTHVADQDDGTPMFLSQPKPVGPATMSFPLAVGMAFAVAPYLDLIKGKPFKARLDAISNEAQVPLWATADGKPPKRRAHG